MKRVLVVGGSHLMCRLIEQLAPGRVRVEHAASFAEAQRALSASPPQAAIFNITPCHLKWRLLINLCLQRDPPIPFVCCTSLPEHHELLLDLPSEAMGVFATPSPIGNLKVHLRDLIDHAPSIDDRSHPRQDQLQ